MIPNAPGVQMQPIPDDGIAEESDDEDAKPHSADHRISSEAFFLSLRYTFSEDIVVLQNAEFSSALNKRSSRLRMFETFATHELARTLWVLNLTIYNARRIFCCY